MLITGSTLLFTVIERFLFIASFRDANTVFRRYVQNARRLCLTLTVVPCLCWMRSAASVEFSPGVSLSYITSNSCSLGLYHFVLFRTVSFLTMCLHVSENPSSKVINCNKSKQTPRTQTNDKEAYFILYHFVGNFMLENLGKAVYKVI